MSISRFAILSALAVLSLSFVSEATAVQRKPKLQAQNTPEIEVHLPEEIVGQAGQLNEIWDTLTGALRHNKEFPGKLVRDMVSLSLTQLDIYSFLRADAERAPLVKMKISNGTFNLLDDIVDNFKLGLRKLLDRLTKGETAELEVLSKIDPEDILQLRQLYRAAPFCYRPEQVGITMERIRCYVDIRERLVARFAAAYPLVKRMASVISKVHRGFMEDRKSAAAEAVGDRAVSK